MRAELQQCRQNFGAPPRSFRFWDWPYLHMRRMPWMRLHPHDWLATVYRRQRQLRRDGRVVWGVVVQANVRAFEPGPSDWPASVIFSPEPSFDDSVDELITLAHGLYDVKGESVADPQLQEFSRVLADEVDRAPGLQVPLSLTRGRKVYHTAIMVVRKHLPGGCLTNNYFPLVVDPADWKAAMILPSRYWSDGVLQDWDTKLPDDSGVAPAHSLPRYPGRGRG